MPSPTTLRVANETQRNAAIQAVGASAAGLGGRLRAAAWAAAAAAGTMLALMAASAPAAYAAGGSAPAAPSSRSATLPAAENMAKGAQAPCNTLPASGPTWMHDIALCLASRKLSEIVIPGSHDSATFGFRPGQGLDIATTQDEDLPQQLNDGMRSFDVRVEFHNGDNGVGFYAHHGSGFTDQISPWLTLQIMFNSISQWAHTPGHEQEIIQLNLSMDPHPDGADCHLFGQQMGQALLTPDQINHAFGTTDLGQVTLGQLWSLPNTGAARVIINNIPCLEAAYGTNLSQWGADGGGYYADQCTAFGIQNPPGNQVVGIVKPVLAAAEHRFTIGSGPPNSLPTPFGPPNVGGLYELDIQGTPEAGLPIGPSVPSCLVTPLSMLPDERAVLSALFADPGVAAGHYLNVVHADFVEQTDLFKDAMAWNEEPLVPASPAITYLGGGAGYFTVEFFDKSYGTDPIAYYTVTATDYNNPASSRTVSGFGSPITMRGLINGDTYYVAVTATNRNGTSAPSAFGAVTVGEPPKFVSGPAANGVVGKPYSSGFAFTGAPSPIVRLVYGSAPPPGLTLDSNGSGNLTGTPKTAGSYTFTVKAWSPLVNQYPRATATITISGGMNAKITN
jgi:hypothetical protein